MTLRSTPMPGFMDGHNVDLTASRRAFALGTATRMAMVLACAWWTAAAAQLPAPAVPKGAVWKYHAEGMDLGTAWRARIYDDSAWPSGAAPLGYGEPYIATTVPFGPNPANKYRTTYFRIPFVVSGDPDSVMSMSLTANYDDGFVAYVNGQEVVRRSMPAGLILYNAFAVSHEAGEYETIDISAFVDTLFPDTNVLAVEVHQVDTSSTDLVMDMELRFWNDPAYLKRGPYLQVGTPNRMTVRWRTDEPVTSRVDYGAALGVLTTSVSDTTLTTEHEIELTGLSPGTQYYYQVGTAGTVLAGGEPGYAFTTPPPSGSATPTRVWVLGDSGTKNANARAVRDAYRSYAPATPTDLWLMLGDNAYPTGSDAEYQAAVFDMYPDMLRSTALWPTRGNHEQLFAGPDNDYYEIFTMPDSAEAGGVASLSEAYYSFDHANIHFICLDSQGSVRTPGGPMHTWLTADLAATKQDWVIAFWHHPPYTKGSHNSDDSLDSGGSMKQMREFMLPVLEAGGVDLVLTGHSHSYERSFLLDGHYGLSNTLRAANMIDPRDGRIDGDGPYRKPSAGPAPHEGAVYTVAGSSGQIGPGTFNHPVMIKSLQQLGSLVIDVDGLTLDARFLNSAGVVSDSFRIVKGGSVSTAPEAALNRPRIELAGSNPARGAAAFAFTLPTAGEARLSVLDVSGRRVRTLARGPHAAGRHELVWDGRDARGARIAAGVYFATLEANGEVSAIKVVLAR